MVTCPDLYSRWKKYGNFCHKSHPIAHEIEAYINYVERQRLEAYEINRCALKPFISIERYIRLHKTAMADLKQMCLKIGGKNITRRLSIEIINRANEKIPPSYRIKAIPGVRSRMDMNYHSIEAISWETRQRFNQLRNILGKDNDVLISAMIDYCTKNASNIEELITAKKEYKKDDEQKQEDNDNDILIISSK